MNESLQLIDCHLINMFQTLGTQKQHSYCTFLGPSSKIVWKWQKKKKKDFKKATTQKQPCSQRSLHFSADSIFAGTEKWDCL